MILFSFCADGFFGRDCLPLCPSGNNCMVIYQRPQQLERIINLLEVELYQGSNKLAPASLNISMSSTYQKDSGYAAKCNDGVLNGDVCHTDSDLEPNSGPWLLLNAGSQRFDRVVVHNRQTCCGERIQTAALILLTGQVVTTSPLSFMSKGTNVLPIYNFCAAGYKVVDMTCSALCPLGNNCVLISKKSLFGDEFINLREVELYMDKTKLTSSSLSFSMSSVYNDFTVSRCNDDVTTVFDESGLCNTANGDRDAWILINAGLQTFNRVIVYNRNDGTFKGRMDSAILTMYHTDRVRSIETTSFSSIGSSLTTYVFCASQLQAFGTTCLYDPSYELVKTVAGYHRCKRSENKMKLSFQACESVIF